MNIILYTTIIIAISVTLSTIINVLIMRKVSEMAVVELEKIFEKVLTLIENLVRNNNISK